MPGWCTPAGGMFPAQALTHDSNLHSGQGSQTRSVLASPPTCMSPLYGMHKFNVLEANSEKVVGMPEANHEWKRTPRGTPSFSNTITKPLRHDIIKTKLSAFMEKLSQHLSNSVERATGADKNREVTGARLLPYARSLERYRESFSSPHFLFNWQTFRTFTKSPHNTHTPVKLTALNMILSVSRTLVKQRHEEHRT